MTDFLTNADHWRRRAELTRALAANAVKDQGRLLKVAEEYDRLARSPNGAEVLRSRPAPTLRQASPNKSASIEKSSGEAGISASVGAWRCRGGAEMRRHTQMCDL